MRARTARVHDMARPGRRLCAYTDLTRPVRVWVTRGIYISPPGGAPERIGGYALIAHTISSALKTSSREAPPFHQPANLARSFSDVDALDVARILHI